MTLSNEPAQIKIATKEAIGIKSQTSSSQNLATSSDLSKPSVKKPASF